MPDVGQAPVGRMRGILRNANRTGSEVEHVIMLTTCTCWRSVESACPLSCAAFRFPATLRLLSVGQKMIVYSNTGLNFCLTEIAESGTPSWLKTHIHSKRR